MTAPPPDRQTRRISLAVKKDTKHVGADWKLRGLGWIRRRLTDLRNLFRQLFPATVDETSEPIVILPGHAARITLDVRGPASIDVHVYAETHRIAGDSALRTDIARRVALDPEGRGSAVILATPKEEQAAGQSRLRIFAVDPADPETIADRIDGIDIVQAGTAASLYTVYGILIVLAVAVQVAVQVFLDGIPFVGAAIAATLIAILFMTSRADGITFAPHRLLPLGQRLTSAVLAIFAVALWWAMMQLNTLGENPARLNCDEPGAGACTPGYVLFDNVTAILASVGFAFATMLALAPAIRPRWIAGRMAVMAALFPLMIYDFTLVGIPKLDDSECIQITEGGCQDKETVYAKAQIESDLSALPRIKAEAPEATTEDTSAPAADAGKTGLPREETEFWSRHRTYLLTKGVVASYGGIGWGLAWLGILFVAARNRADWRLIAGSGVLAAGFLVSMPTFFTYKFFEGGILAYTGYMVVVAHLLGLRWLLGMCGRRQVPGTLLFALAVAGAMWAVAWFDIQADATSQKDEGIRPHSTSLFHTAVVLVLAIAWLCGEAGLLRWLRRRSRRRDRMPEAEPQPG